MHCTRDTKWETADGRMIPIRCMTDTHIANTIDHVKKYPHMYTDDILEVLETEAKERGLSREFLSRAPIPWQDVDVKWKRLDMESRGYKVIGRDK